MFLSSNCSKRHINLIKLRDGLMMFHICTFLTPTQYKYKQMLSAK